MQVRNWSVAGALRSTVALAVALHAFQGVRAWAQHGHRATAQIAHALLSPQARQDVDALLLAAGFRSIGTAAHWPDRIRKKERPETKPWHFVGVNDDPPKGKCTLAYPDDCPNNVCVVTAIANQTMVAADPARPVQERGEAVAYLLHFVADVSQPMHATGYLRGGIRMPVTFNRRRTSLHSIWDREMLRKTISAHGSIVEYIHFLLAKVQGPWVPPQALLLGLLPGVDCVAAIDPANATTTEMCARAWAQDSLALTCEVAYPSFLERRMETSTGYYENAKDTVDRQILVGGVRLAALLNKIFAVPLE